MRHELAIMDHLMDIFFIEWLIRVDHTPCVLRLDAQNFCGDFADFYFRHDASAGHVDTNALGCFK